MTKAKAAPWSELFAHSCFDLRSTFVLRISSFSRAMIQMRSAECGIKQLTTDYGQLTTNHERSQIRHPPNVEAQGLLAAGRVDPRAGHRRNNGRFQRRRQGLAEPDSRPQRRSADHAARSGYHA